MIKLKLKPKCCYYLEIPEEYRHEKPEIILSRLEEWRDKEFPGYIIANMYGDFYLIEG